MHFTVLAVWLVTVPNKCPETGTVVTSILQMRKLSHKPGRQHAHHHTPRAVLPLTLIHGICEQPWQWALPTPPHPLWHIPPPPGCIRAEMEPRTPRALGESNGSGHSGCALSDEFLLLLPGVDEPSTPCPKELRLPPAPRPCRPPPGQQCFLEASSLA